MDYLGNKIDSIKGFWFKCSITVLRKHKQNLIHIYEKSSVSDYLFLQSKQQLRDWKSRKDKLLVISSTKSAAKFAHEYVLKNWQIEIF